MNQMVIEEGTLTKGQLPKLNGLRKSVDGTVASVSVPNVIGPARFCPHFGGRPATSARITAISSAVNPCGPLGLLRVVIVQ